MKIFLSEFIFLVLKKRSDIFLIWENISQIKIIFLSKLCGICSVTPVLLEHKFC